MAKDTGRWYALRWKILQRDNFTCQYCGQRAPEVILHIDHRNPKVNGGDNAEDNLVTACSACNIGKGITTLIPTLFITKQKKGIKTNMEVAIFEFLSEEKKATATEVHKALAFNRVNISTFLNKGFRDGILGKTRGQGRTGIYFFIK